MPAEQQLNGCVLSTTAIAAWQDWVSAVKVDERSTVTWKPLSLADIFANIRRNAPQKHGYCSPFLAISAGFTPQPLKS